MTTTKLLKSNKLILSWTKEGKNEQCGLTKIQRDVKDPHRIIAPMDFNPHLPKISEVLKKHHRSMLKNAPHLREIFHAPPMASFRQPPNLRRLICKSKLHEVNKGKRVVRGRKNVERVVKSAHSDIVTG